MSTKKDMLERIADALDGGGDFGQGTVNEIGYLERIAKYLEEHGLNGGSSDSGSDGDSSSSGDFVKITATWEDGEPTLDKTSSEITEIIESGKVPYIWGGEYPAVYMLSSYDTESGFRAKFAKPIQYGSGTTGYVTEIDIQGSLDGDYVSVNYMDVTVSKQSGD